MKKVVITGGAGFIGSHIAEECVTHNFEVVVIDDLSTSQRKNLELFFDKITFIEGSILDVELLRKAFENADVVFHQAALPSVPKSVEFPIETNMANVQGTLNVFVAARDAKVKRVVYASSSSVYGDSPVLPKVETMPYNPLSPYAAQKMMGEYYGKLFFKLYALETVGLRYFNVFGPRQNPASKYAAVIPLFITKIMENISPVINGDGSTTRDFTYVKNVVQANLKAAVAPNVGGDVFNIACGETISLQNLVDAINIKLHKKVIPEYGLKRAGDIDFSLADITKAKTKLGFEPTITFEQGLQATIQSLQGKT
jgi:nucleoside-diphosphate-sugar epimerase